MGIEKKFDLDQDCKRFDSLFVSQQIDPDSIQEFAYKKKKSKQGLDLDSKWLKSSTAEIRIHWRVNFLSK